MQLVALATPVFPDVNANFKTATHRSLVTCAIDEEGDRVPFTMSVGLLFGSRSYFGFSIPDTQTHTHRDFSRL